MLSRNKCHKRKCYPVQTVCRSSSSTRALPSRALCSSAIVVACQHLRQKTLAAYCFSRKLTMLLLSPLSTGEVLLRRQAAASNNAHAASLFTMVKIVGKSRLHVNSSNNITGFSPFGYRPGGSTPHGRHVPYILTETLPAISCRR